MKKIIYKVPIPKTFYLRPIPGEYKVEIKPKFLPFKSARTFVRRLHLSSGTQWNAYCAGRMPEKGKCPANIPSVPSTIYKDKGWKGIGDWLGTKSIANRLRQFRNFKLARKHIHTLNINSQKEWQIFCKNGLRPIDIPSNPDRKYKFHGWQSWGDWLGTGRTAKGGRPTYNWLPYEKAERYAHSLKLSRRIDWIKLYKKGKLPESLPASPDNVYKNKGWTSWGVFLGTGKVAVWLKQYPPFEEARIIAHKLNLKSKTEWESLDKNLLPENLPTDPRSSYKDKGWKTWGDFLGTGSISKHERMYRSFKQARTFARSLNLKTLRDWQKYSKGDFPKKGNRPADIPSDPYDVYRNKGWTNWSDWLGKNIKKTK